MKTKQMLAIHELLNRAAYYFDVRDIDGLEACFCEDARMLVDVANGDTFGPFDGRDSIMELMRGTLEAQKDNRRHIICFGDQRCLSGRCAQNRVRVADCRSPPRP